MTLVYHHKILSLATWANATRIKSYHGRKKTSQNKSWHAKRHIGGSLFMGHKIFWDDIS
jgi:hypothetical protein